jgi:phosphomannomutase
MAKINKEIFKAYDIRGIYPSDLNEEIIYKIGRAYATLIQNENEDKKLTIVVGRDMRLSSPQLSKALIKGLTEQGVDVVDIGLASTPTFYFAVGHCDYDGGALVSASHNPKEYNGLKMVRRKAIPVSGDTGIMEIKEMVLQDKFGEAKEKGTVREKEGVLQEQIQHDLKYADVSKIKPFKVVADPANAMGVLYLEELFKHLPCQLIKMNFELDGTFPAHQPDPIQEENVEELKKRVKEEKADLGIAPDGDGDRIFYVDDRGEIIPPHIIRGMLAQIFLKDHPGAKICYDIRPGKITEDMVREAGGIPIVTKVGHSLIKETMIKEDAIFAGESSGHFYLKMPSGSYEVPVIATLKLLEIMSKKSKPISEIINPYDKYFHSGEINSEVEDKSAKIKEIAEKYKDAKKILWIDGVTIEYDDFWFNVRPSNTEPLLRLNLEAKTKELMKKKREELLSLIRK